MATDDWGYDTDLMDAEICVDNTTTEAYFTTSELAAYFGHERMWIWRQRKKGYIPDPIEPAVPLPPGGKGPGIEARWSRRQLIEIVAGRLERGERVPG